jgi:hypothetical protein
VYKRPEDDIIVPTGSGAIKGYTGVHIANGWSWCGVVKQRKLIEMQRESNSRRVTEMFS